MDIGELKRFAAEIGEPEYRAEQIMSWLIRGAENSGDDKPAASAERKAL